MTLNDAALLATALAGITAVATLTFGLYRWGEQRQHEQLQDFRKELAAYRSASYLYRESYSDLSAIEAGNIAAKHLISISEPSSGQEVKSFLSKADPTEVILGSLVRGYSDATSQRRQVEALTELRQSSGRQNEAFPVLNRLLVIVTNFLSRFADVDTKARIVHKMIADETLPQTIIDGLEDTHDRGMIFSVISDHFSQIGAIGTSRNVEVTGLLHELIEVVLGNYLDRSDGQLLAASKNERRQRAELGTLDHNTFTDEISELIGYLQSNVTQSEWTKLVELRTRLLALYE